jgi:hypothetical protein
VKRPLLSGTLLLPIAAQLVKNEGLKMKSEMKKAPVYTGEGAVKVPGAH